MPYANSQGARTHCHVQGAGPTLALRHGFTSRLEAWRQFGRGRALRSRCRPIPLDARGHGAGDKPHDPAVWALPRRVGGVLAVLGALNIREAYVFGCSMGGWSGFGMAQYAQERAHSFTSGGAHPYRDSRWDAFGQGDGTGPEAFMAAPEVVIG